MKLELSKMKEQRTQWHEEFVLKLQEFDQREKHWFWQRGFWFLMTGAAFGGVGVKVFTG